MKLSLLAVSACLIYCFTLHAQQVDNGKITIGQVDSIYSTVLKENRVLWVHVPVTNPHEGERFPVVYLLDGDGHFPSVVGMIRQLSTTNGNTTVPKMIVVGISNTNRTRDLTPYLDPENADVNASGGGEKFMDFMQDELMPYIDKTYPTRPYRMYIGHSFGGLTVINTLLKRPELFNSYIAIDPSLWWANSAILKESKTILNNKNLADKSLFVGIAHTFNPNMDIDSVVKDTTENTQHIRDILKFSKTVVPQSKSKLQFEHQYYPNDSHGSVPLIATYDALRYIFKWFDLDTGFITLMINEESTADMVVKKLEDHYKTVSVNLGYTILPPENLVNQMGYGCLQRDMFSKAEAFFKLNVTNFPNHSNVYDSLGDYYAAVEQTDKAIEAYEKALNTANGNSYSQEKLDALKNKE